MENKFESIGKYESNTARNFVADTHDINTINGSIGHFLQHKKHPQSIRKQGIKTNVFRIYQTDLCENPLFV